TPVIPDPEVERSSCEAPGPRIYTDPPNDVPVAALAIQSLSVAERATEDGSHKIVFTIKVRDLQTIQPGYAWMVLWNRPQPDGTYDRNYVVVRATPQGTI